MADRPLCFIVMPFGLKKDPGGGPDIDFDRIYARAIQPGVEAAGMEPVRADEERIGGIIHKPMFERLLLCDYALVDLTTGNPNVFYELGVRHAARPATTLTLYARHQQIPFDVAYARALPYDLGGENRFGEAEAGRLRAAVTTRFRELRERSVDEPGVDSPLFQLMQGYPAPDIARLKTDVFREQVSYARDLKRRLAKARDARDAARIHELERTLGPADTVEAGVFVDLFLSYRAVEDWQAMIDLYGRLPAALKRSVLIREQLGFAHNRAGNRDEALRVLNELVAEQGPSSETCALIGRVYKDKWSEARRAGREAQARGYLRQAIDAYGRGFETDWRDAYPGINAVTLLDIEGSEASLAAKREMVPVVRYAVLQRIKSAQPDYWDYATLLELAVLDQDEPAAAQRLSAALAAVREPWEPKTTRNNLVMIRDARRDRGIQEPWLDGIIEDLASPSRRAG
jgi:tetratricopeptide (TPR) repeat protein